MRWNVDEKKCEIGEVTYESDVLAQRKIKKVRGKEGMGKLKEVKSGLAARIHARECVAFVMKDVMWEGGGGVLTGKTGKFEADVDENRNRKGEVDCSQSVWTQEQND